MPPERDPFAILGVPRDAGREVIAAAYRRLARLHHPDAGARQSRAMSDINWAWAVLSDPARRREWEANARPGPPAGHWTVRSGAPRPWQPPAAGWATSGEAWARSEGPRTARWATVGCLPLAVVTIVLSAIVLFAALGSDQAPVTEGEASDPPAVETTAP